MPSWFSELLESSNYFMPHGHCYLWLPSLLWLHVLSDLLIGSAYVGISLILYLLVRKIRLPFSPVFIAFGLFIGLCGLTHFMNVWTVWNPDYLADGLIKAATAAASVATAIGLVFLRPQVEEVVHTARLSEERRIQLESTHAELQALYQKVKELDELKTQFFANVSHELRTPLTLILGPAERMANDSNLTAEQRRQLDGISRNGQMLLKQVNDLLDMSKLEAGKMPIQYAQLDLVPWFRRIAAQFESVAEQRRIAYRIDAPARLPAQVDPDLLERVFINLLSNAFKFTPPEGDIQVVLADEEHSFRFSVADTGPGIALDQQKSIFERFRQAEGGATRRYGGTGLGLAIVKDFIEMHGGQIEVTSTPGQGAYFAVHLPRTAPAGSSVAHAPAALGTMTQVALEGALLELTTPQAGTAADQPHPHLPNRPYVLVVEDNLDMREFVASTLCTEFNVVTAADGQEGLARALALQPDLIVTDMMMPHLSGEQLVAALRTRNEFHAVPILLLTAKTDDALRTRLLQSGAQDYLTKPFMPQELLARTNNLIAMKRTGDTLRTELASLSLDIEGLAKELASKNRQLQVALDATEVAREQAEQASQVKSQFLALVSHELRTPLATLDMNLQLLEHNKEQPLPEAQKLRLNRLARATQQMASLIEGLLEYTRVESGRLLMHAQPIDAATLAVEVVEAYRENAAANVPLMFEPPPAPLPEMVSDARLLRVVLSNLVSNALKFTPQGQVRVIVGYRAGQHIFEVQDSGIGIAPADIPRIFEPFEQLEPVQRKSVPGVGLGLALVKRIVDALGGNMEVHSTVGIGSRFVIQLPSQRPAHP